MNPTTSSSCPLEIHMDPTSNMPRSLELDSFPWAWNNILFQAVNHKTCDHWYFKAPTQNLYHCWYQNKTPNYFFWLFSFLTRYSSTNALISRIVHHQCMAIVFVESFSRICTTSLHAVPWCLTQSLDAGKTISIDFIRTYLRSVLPTTTLSFSTDFLIPAI